MRDNLVIILVGNRKTGKTDFIKPVIVNSNLPKKLIVDTFDSAVWRNLKTHDHLEWEHKEVPIVEMNQLEKWNSGTYRCFSSDTNKMMSTIQEHLQNCLIVFEDATKYVRSKLQEDVRKFVIDSKQKNLDIVFVFHSLTSVPPELAWISDLLVIKRTGEALNKSLKDKFPVSEFVPAFEKVNNSKNRFEHKTIRLN